mmetsp:Transcript_9133/g.16642  ORF Transcript_9133/g.16642 Transcript_9133/m.16642 type:complete len:227 (-) Transcript_9133:281-961(-)
MHDSRRKKCFTIHTWESIAHRMKFIKKFRSELVREIHKLAVRREFSDCSMRGNSLLDPVVEHLLQLCRVPPKIQKPVPECGDELECCKAKIIIANGHYRQTLQRLISILLDVACPVTQRVYLDMVRTDRTEKDHHDSLFGCDLAVVECRPIQNALVQINIDREQAVDSHVAIRIQNGKVTPDKHPFTFSVDDTLTRVVHCAVTFKHKIRSRFLWVVLLRPYEAHPL